MGKATNYQKQELRMFEAAVPEALTFAQAEAKLFELRSERKRYLAEMPIQDLSSSGWFDRWLEDSPRAKPKNHP